MSSLSALTEILKDATPENRQALIVCLLNRTGPVKFPLTSDFGAGGLFTKVNEVLDGIADTEERTHRTAALITWLSQKHCEWVLRPQPVDA